MEYHVRVVTKWYQDVISFRSIRFLFPNFNRQLLFLALFACALLGLGVQGAHAVTGQAWLSTQSQLSGSYSSSADIATELQSTSESLRAFTVTGETTNPDITAAAQFIEAENYLSTEYLARQIISRLDQGLDATALVATLITHQNPDGGFGEMPGYESTRLDTAFALEALVSAGEGASAESGLAIGYLIDRQSADGSWADGTNEPTVYTTAIVSKALAPLVTSYTELPAVLTQAKNFLMSQMDVSGSWGESFLDALAILAIVAIDNDSTAISDSIAALANAQAVDGSWGGDVYQTALALRALNAVELAQFDPTLAQINGRVTDAGTGLPLAGVQISLQGAGSFAVTSNSDGSFVVRNVTAGSYTLSAALTDYATLSASVDISGGATLDVGLLTLARSQTSTTGIIFGAFHDAVSGTPLVGVTVSVQGTAKVAVTDNAGSYQISSVTPGNVTVQASKNGYSSAILVGTVSSGGALVFSDGLTQVSAPDSVIKGIVTDATSGLPIEGVSVSLSGANTATAVTNALGEYAFAGLVEGGTTIGMSMLGYDPVAVTIPVYANAVNYFSPSLYLETTTPAGAYDAGVSGRVIDATTNLPLSGVQVEAIFGGSTGSVTTDANGVFTVAGLVPGTGSLQFTMTGYSSSLLSLSLSPISTKSLGDVRLLPTGASVLLPDIAVLSIDDSTMQTDQKTLKVTGTLMAELQNVGTINVQSSVDAIAFYDVNKDGRFEEGADALFGDLQGISVSAVGTSQIIQIPVNGTLPYRDAPIIVFADSAHAVVESNEVNNQTSKAAQCLAGGIGVADLTASAVQVVNNGQGQPLSLLARIGNAGLVASAAGIEVAFYEGNPAVGGVLLGTTTIAALQPDTYQDAQLDNVTSLAGLIDIFTVVDGINVEIECNETNNTASAKGPQLYPDLTVEAIDLSSVAQDQDTLTMTGNAIVTVKNQGFVYENGAVDLVVFFDADGSGTFESANDIVLGSTTIATPVYPISHVDVTLAIDGSLPFRDAPIYAMVDPGNSVVEENETNNSLTNQSVCRAERPVGSINPVQEWSYPAYSFHSPIVGPLMDTNSDGLVNESDVPAVVFINEGSRMVAIDGLGGSEYWTVSSGTFNAAGAPVLGDIDGDGIPEVVAFDGNYIMALNHNGSVKWRSAVGIRTDVLGGQVLQSSISIADLDGDGNVEILAGNLVLNSDGSLKWEGSGAKLYRSKPLAVDLDLRDGLEVIMGQNVYHADGTLYWSYPDSIYNTGADQNRNLPAVANLDDDVFPEIVLTNSKLAVFEHDGTLKWGPVQDGQTTGPAVVADFDNDGLAEIGVSSRAWYRVYEHDGTLKWEMPINDPSSGSDGASAFDLDGDGQLEIFYVDHTDFYIFNGNTGEVIFTTPYYTPSNFEYPTIADVDADGHAEIILPAARLVETGPVNVRVFGDANNSWMPTDKIWNQYHYHIDNINPDGSVPTNMVRSWLGHNTFRAAKAYEFLGDPKADLTVGRLQVIDNGAGQAFSIQARIGNAGLAASPDGVVLAFYEGDPGAGGTLVGSVTLNALNSGAWQDVMLTNVATLSGQPIYAVIDDTGLVDECNELNNIISKSIPVSTQATLSVANDAPIYGPNSPVSIQTTVSNTGELVGTYAVELLVEDANGILVHGFPLANTGEVGGGQSVVLPETWNTGSIIAGAYRLHAILKQLDGTVVADAVSGFVIDQANAGSPAATLRTTTDRLTYHTTDTVLIQDLVTNVTSNTILEDVRLQVTVTDATAATVFTDNQVLGQMTAGALKNVTSSYSFLAVQPGTFTVTAILTDASTQSTLASNQLQYTVQEDLSRSLTGSVTAQTATLNIGDTQVCTSTINNTGVTNITGLQVRQLMVNPATAAEVDNYAVTVDLAAGATQNINRTLATSGLVDGAYSCILQYNQAGVWQTLAYTTFSLVNQPPVANAGLAQTGTVTDTIQLDGTASSDPNGHSLTYSWTLIQQPVGSAVVLAAATTATPTLSPDVRGQYVAQLIVNDGMVDSTPATVIIDILNSPPVADAGPDQLVYLGDMVTLSGIMSSDADGDPLSYQWTMVNKPVDSQATLSDAAVVSPTFTVDAHGNYILELVVNDGFENSQAATVVITVQNNLPVAVTGADQTAFVGDTVFFDGSASSDADGDPLSYSWSIISAPLGSTAALINAGTATPSLVVDKKGDFVVELVVNDGYDDSLPVTTLVSVTNTPPVANAGPDQLIHIGDLVTLDGSASTDADGDPITYLWSLVSAPVGSVATLSDPTAVMPTISIDALGEYVLELIVDDGQVVSVADQVLLNAVNVAPVANAGADQSVSVGQIVQLNGSASSDADGDPITYQWSIIDAPVGSVATLSDPAIASPTLTIDVFGTYTVQLIVNDGVVDSAPDTVILNVVNTPPVANAGPDQAVFVGDNVILDGSASSDADGDLLSYSWSLIQQPAGSTAVLVDTTTATPSIVIDQQGIYIAQLIVNDGIVDSAPDTVVLNVANVRPTANAGADQTVSVPTTVTLDGSGSADADNDPLTYQWSISSLPTGSTAVISDPAAVSPTIDVDLAGDYVIQLMVNDGTINSLPDTVTITGDALCLPDMQAYGYNGRVDLYWTPEANVDHYRIYRNDVGDGSPYALVDDYHHGSMSSFTDYNVNGGTTYYYRVEAIRTDDSLCHSPTVNATPSGGGHGGGGHGGGM